MFYAVNREEMPTSALSAVSVTWLQNTMETIELELFDSFQRCTLLPLWSDVVQKLIVFYNYIFI